MPNDTDSNTVKIDSLVPWRSGPQQRGAFGIIWSCIAMIVTCTWTVLHLNVPASTDNYSIRLQRQFKWMVVMIVFPEFVFSHAVLELKMALDDYLSMSANNERLAHFLHRGWCAHPRRSARLIRGTLTVFSMTLRGRLTVSDYAPGDLDAPHTVIKDLVEIFFKAPTDNLRQHQPVNQDNFLDTPHICREHSCYRWTLTHSFFANMGGLVSASNSARVPYVTLQGNYLLSSFDHAKALMASNHFSKDEILDKSKADTFVRVLWILQILRLVIVLTGRAFYHYSITQLEVIAVSFAAISLLTVLIQIKKPQDVGRPMILRGDPMAPLPHSLLPASLCTIYLERDIEDVPNDKPQSPRFPNDNFRPTERNKALFQNMLAFSTVAFGVIHCAAWNFQFASSIEQWIWRACSLAGAVLPLIILLATVLLLDPHFRGRKRKVHEEWRQVRSCKDKISSKLAHNFRQNHPLHPNFLHLDDNVGLHRILRARDWTDKLEHDLQHRYPYQYHAAPPDIIAELRGMRAALDDTYTIATTLARLSRLFDFIQIGAILVYLGSRLALLVIAFLSFRLAPSGIYRDTWAGFLPTVQ